MAIESVYNAVPNDDSNYSMKIPNKSDLRTLMLEKRSRYQSLEQMLNGLQNRAAFASEDELPELQNKGRLIRMGINIYIEALHIYQKMYQKYYATD